MTRPFVTAFLVSGVARASGQQAKRLAVLGWHRPEVTCVERDNRLRIDSLGEHDHRRIDAAQGKVAIQLDEIGDSRLIVGARSFDVHHFQGAQKPRLDVTAQSGAWAARGPGVSTAAALAKVVSGAITSPACHLGDIQVVESRTDPRADEHATIPPPLNQEVRRW